MRELKDSKKMWDKKNVWDFKGKEFSVLGDSISTLEGFNPPGYHVFFDNKKCLYAHINNWKETWWGEVIETCGGNLLVNNSWSGSRVSRLPDSLFLFPSGCSKERTMGLHGRNLNGEIITPDIIMIYLGTNDWAYGVPLKSNAFCSKSSTDAVAESRLQKKEKTCFFVDAYNKMLEEVHRNYPFAEIWCCSLLATYMSSKKSFQFPAAHGGIAISDYNQAICKIVKRFQRKWRWKIRFLDLYQYQIPYDSIDGSHPNRDGMHTIASLVIREIQK